MDRTESLSLVDTNFISRNLITSPPVTALTSVLDSLILFSTFKRSWRTIIFFEGPTIFYCNTATTLIKSKEFISIL